MAVEGANNSQKPGRIEQNTVAKIARQAVASVKVKGTDNKSPVDQAAASKVIQFSPRVSTNRWRKPNPCDAVVRQVCEHVNSGDPIALAEGTIPGRDVIVCESILGLLA